jgi:hypothetical protein
LTLEVYTSGEKLFKKGFLFFVFIVLFFPSFYIHKLKMKLKKLVLSIGILMLVLVSLNFVVGDNFWACFERGQEIDFCNPQINDRTCGRTLCRYCMSDYDEVNNCYSPGAFNACNDEGPECSIGGGEIDENPPELTINEPLNEEIYTNRKVYVDIEVNEKSDLYYLDNYKGRGRWVRMCNDCWKYEGARSFDEGENYITFKAIDSSGNVITEDVYFSLDSRDPRIRSTEPRRGFANGEFSVEYDELSLDKVILYYGIYGDMREEVLNDCVSGENMECNVEVDLSDFDGEEISYYFKVEDLAGNYDESKEGKLDVDISEPVIKSLEYEKDESNVEFKIEIEEENLEVVEYKDMGDSRGRWKRLCSRLDDGICEGRARLDDGNRTIAIQIVDEAGFIVSESLEIFVDSKGPRIRSTEPRRGFANGNFLVEFDEVNPTDIILNYGTSEEMRTKELSLGDCYFDRSTVCETNVNLDDLDGEEIKYWFEVKDLAENYDKSREVGLSVDISFPVIENIDYEINRGRVNFEIEINEENLAEVSYIDYSDSRARWRRMCSRLRNGICERTIPLRGEGGHNIGIQVIDDAGNSVSENILINIVD